MHISCTTFITIFPQTHQTSDPKLQAWLATCFRMTPTSDVDLFGFRITILRLPELKKSGPVRENVVNDDLGDVNLEYFDCLSWFIGSHDTMYPMTEALEAGNLTSSWSQALICPLMMLKQHHSNCCYSSAPDDPKNTWDSWDRLNLRDWKTSALYLFSATRCSQKVVCLVWKIRQPNTYPPILGKTPGHAGNRKKHNMLQLETSVENFRGQTFWDSEIQKGQITGSSLVFAGTLLTRSTGPQILYTNHPHCRLAQRQAVVDDCLGLKRACGKQHMTYQSAFSPWNVQRSPNTPCKIHQNPYLISDMGPTFGGA